ncbi:MAG: VWA domain-containing protein [Acidobacteriia bacterium]|nr:VWA domain-containing protein [Terriglobia bacterium]
MRLSSRSKRRQSGATIVLLMVMLPLMLLPLTGLAIDGTRLYIVQSKLSAAVDGAALGAGRLLGTKADTAEIAGEFLNANFPPGYWGTNGLVPDISAPPPVLGVSTITINASVNLPLTFARLMGQSQSVISASAQATRRVTRVELVLDRSGSMSNNDALGKNVFNYMKSGAKWFTSQFTPGYDELGLVVFSGGGLVAYPTAHPWNPNPNSAGGPDKDFAINAQLETGPMFDSLNAMSVGGGTGTAEALAMAYIELQKAHNRDLVANGNDNTLNTIVLFTDGVPDAIATYVNDPASNSLAAGKCPGYNPATGVASTQMRGYIVAPGGPLDSPQWGGTTSSQGLKRLPGFDTSKSLNWWLGPLSPAPPAPPAAACSSARTTAGGACDNINGDPAPAVQSCTYLKGTAPNLQDLKNIPAKDLYGYSTSGNAYTHSYLYNGSKYSSPNAKTYNSLAPQDGYMLAAASWNVTDAIGTAIRSQVAMNQIYITTIGYSGNSGGTDVGLLNRLANTPLSYQYVNDGSQSKSQFWLVNNTAQLQAAFDNVASSMLRLSK